MSTQTQAAATTGLSADERRAIAIEAYLYLYPLVTMEVNHLAQPARRAQRL
jgi:hypothetical protein